jgi:hypothetical protein
MAAEEFTCAARAGRSIPARALLAPLIFVETADVPQAAATPALRRGRARAGLPVMCTGARDRKTPDCRCRRTVLKVTLRFCTFAARR